MPRIRTIKPEFWTSGQVLECSPNARLLFIGLWNFCDDHGRHPYRLRQIKAEVFPADDFTEEDIRGMVAELSENGLISFYTVDDKEFFAIDGWHHQRIDKPQPAKYPAPNGEHSENDRGTLPPDRKGKDRKGEEGREEQPVAGAASNGHDDDPVFLALPCLKNQTYPITESLVAEYEGDFPAVDVRQELRNAVAWIKANPKKKKTHSGARRFLTGWLTRSQNRGGNKPSKDSEEELWKREAWK